MLEDNPRDWHKILSETIWRYKTSKRDSTGVNAYSLTYVQDVVLPMKVVGPSIRVSRQNSLNPKEFNEAMIMELEALNGKILQALDHIRIQKKKVARAYYKRVKTKNFE